MDEYSGNWEAVFFIELATGFGTKINKDAFASLAWQIPYRALCKSRANLLSLEALLMGMGGILERSATTDPYLIDLRREFEYLSQKFDLKPLLKDRLHFFKLRPMNFPTIRLSQLAGLFHHNPDLMTQCIATESLAELHQLLRVGTSMYWETHYTFTNVSPFRLKRTSTSFINTIVINVVLPVKYAFLRSRGEDAWEQLMCVIEQIPPERNSITQRFGEIGIRAHSAKDTQALLQLHSFFCRPKRCLDCAIGHRLLGRK